MNRLLIDWINRELGTRKLSIRELGRKTGIDHSDISKILSGKKEPQLRFYEEIAKIFDEPIEKILQLAGILPNRDVEQLTFAELFEAGRRLSPEQRKELLDYADFLLQKGRRSGGGEIGGQAEQATI